MKIGFIVMYGQYSVHVVQIHFEFQIFIAIVSVYLTRWYPSDIIAAPTQSFVEFENYIYCDEGQY